MVTDTSVFDRQASSQNASIFLVLTEKGTTTALRACVSTSVPQHTVCYGFTRNACHNLAELPVQTIGAVQCQALKKWKGANYRRNVNPHRSVLLLYKK